MCTQHTDLTNSVCEPTQFYYSEENRGRVGTKILIYLDEGERRKDSYAVVTSLSNSSQITYSIFTYLYNVFFFFYNSKTTVARPTVATLHTDLIDLD